MASVGGRPPALSHADEWELYLCRKLGSSLKDCMRVFAISRPTVHRIVIKFRQWDQLLKEYRQKLDSLRPTECDPVSIEKIEPESLSSYARRAWLVRRARPEWANRKAMRAFYREAKRLTRDTGVIHHVDHIYPISSPTICGLHVPANLRITTAALNLAKSNRWEESYE